MILKRIDPFQSGKFYNRFELNNVFADIIVLICSE